jgi:hypothetical protein
MPLLCQFVFDGLILPLLLQPNELFLIYSIYSFLFDVVVDNFEKKKYLKN